MDRVLEFSLALAALAFGHCLADYPLQGDFLARGKSHRAPLPGVPWALILTVHAWIHGGMVFLLGAVVGALFGVLLDGPALWVLLALGVLEFTQHWVIDFAKCDGRIGFEVDQALHLLCKMAWALIIVLVLL